MADALATPGMTAGADVTMRTEVEGMVAGVVEKFGRLDILAVELAPHRINVNNIAPGGIATPINRAVLDDPRAKEEAESEIPWGRGGLTQQVTKY